MYLSSHELPSSHGQLTTCFCRAVAFLALLGHGFPHALGLARLVHMQLLAELEKSWLDLSLNECWHVLAPKPVPFYERWSDPRSFLRAAKCVWRLSIPSIGWAIGLGRATLVAPAFRPSRLSPPTLRPRTATVAELRT